MALAWIGGSRFPRVKDRSFSPKLYKPIQDEFTVVSAQYDLGNPFLQKDREEAGIPKIDDTSSGEDLHDQAALFLAVDAVVTVQQTAVHVAGAVGAPCYALIGEKPHWRYGIEGDSLPFYSSVKLYRKKGEWSEVVQRVLEDLRANHGRIQRAEQATA